MTRALIALTSHRQLGNTGKETGYYVGEAAEPWEVFRAAGWDVDLTSVAGGEPPIDGRDENDTTQNDFLATAGVADTTKAAGVDPSGYDVIVFAGGHGTMWDFPDNPDLARIATSIYERGGVVAAVCHGPSALVNLKLSNGSHLIAGKRVAGFTNDEESSVGLTDEVPFLLADKLTEAGAIHVKAPDFTEHVVTDGRLVTGQNPQSARAMAEAVVQAAQTA